MKSTAAAATMILALSSALAVGVNLARERPLAWIRAELPPQESAEAATTKPALVSADTSATAPAGGAGKPAAIPASGPTTDAMLAYLAAGTVYFVDARENHEYAAGHLRGAIHIPSSAIYQNIEKLTTMVSPNEKVIVYCGGGECEASHHVFDALRRDFGYSDVQIFEKGWAEMEKSGRFSSFIEAGIQP